MGTCSGILHTSRKPLGLSSPQGASLLPAVPSPPLPDSPVTHLLAFQKCHLLSEARPGDPSLLFSAVVLPKHLWPSADRVLASLWLQEGAGLGLFVFIAQNRASS